MFVRCVRRRSGADIGAATSSSVVRLRQQSAGKRPGKPQPSASRKKKDCPDYDRCGICLWKTYAPKESAGTTHTLLRLRGDRIPLQFPLQCPGGGENLKSPAHPRLAHRAAWKRARRTGPLVPGAHLFFRNGVIAVHRRPQMKSLSTSSPDVVPAPPLAPLSLHPPAAVVRSLPWTEPGPPDDVATESAAAPKPW